MKLQHLQGLALILSAICLLLGLVGSTTALFPVIGLIGILLFILGIPAMYVVQRTGWLGWIGIVMLELAALISLAFRSHLVPPSIGESLNLTSAILGMLGAVIIGWLTVREHVFPAWVGWLFTIQGLLNVLAGVFHIPSLAGVLPIIITLLQAVALSAYGYYIYQIP